MSVFSDFQKAWAQRFPNCELPQAWEEDVRANLVKHRQKAAALREELEKEEFYVEYLENLLADVERVKRIPSTSDDGCNQVSFLNDGNPSDRRGSLVENANSLDANCDKSTLIEGKFHSESNRENVNKNCHSGHIVRKPEVRDYSSYVTVIEVSGYNPFGDSTGEPPESPKDVESESSVFGEHNEADSPFQKKKPPAPPKKPRKAVPVQPVTPVKKTIDLPKFPSDVQNNTQHETAFQSYSDHHRNVLVKPPENRKSETANQESKISLQSDSSCFHSLSGKRVPDKTELVDQEVDKFYSDENIYDTVAPDEGDFPCSESTSKSGTLDSAKSLDDSEGDYIMLPQEFSRELSEESSSSQTAVITDSDANTQKLQHDETSPEYATYMNIDYFLQQSNQKCRAASQEEPPGLDSDDDEDTYLVRSFSSDHEIDSEVTAESAVYGTVSTPPISGTNDDVFDLDPGLYGSSVESASFLSNPETSTPPPSKKVANDLEPQKETERRMAMCKCILGSIAESEKVYVECLNVLMQYMKALKSTIGTSQPLLSLEDFNIIFYRIPELHSLHLNFLQGLKSHMTNRDGTQVIGEDFKVLASKLGVYGSFLQNYSKAIEAVRKCSSDNVKFSEITKSIKLKALQGQATTLEDLLHKPIARVQKNALVLHDLLKYTPENHPDFKVLRTALKMTQCFLNDINISAAESMFPVTDRAQRHLVKNSFIVELAEGHRKLRHLFLFSDVIVCAKYKPSTRHRKTGNDQAVMNMWEIRAKRQQQLHGYEAIKSLQAEMDVKENSPYDILSLKSRASNVRDQILKEEKNSQGREKTKMSGRNIDKYKKKLSELEAQLVLASPNLVFRIMQKSGKAYTFFLSSEFEKAQWLEAISVLQSTAPSSPSPISLYELQAWITSCRKHLGTNLGTFLLRSGKDEDLLVGDLYLSIHSLHNLSKPSDVYLCFEVDSYGHFFNKAKTRTCCNTTEPIFDQDFMIELEGSQTLRILCYESQPKEGAVLRGKGALELSRSWLTDKAQEKSVSLQELTLIIGLKYMPPELSLRRIPSSKAAGVFGVKIQQVCKKEKSPVPFIVTSCVREVEKRGIHEVGIYRVSGSASDIQKLKKSFETNVYEAEQLLKEVDIHSVTGLFKMYLRELPEALFTDSLYQKFFAAFSMGDQEEKKKQLLALFDFLPEVNQGIIKYLLDHLIRINQCEGTNKMSLHNLATVFGPTLLRPGSRSSTSSPADLLTAGTVDVMAQAGIFYFFLKRHAAGLPLKASVQS